MNERPEGMTEEHFTYLDNLRESGVTNMYGGGEYLAQEFGLAKNVATKYLCHWMETFEERANAEEDEYAASEQQRKEEQS